MSNYIGDFVFGLVGGGEELRLFNETGDLVDNVYYNDNSPWPDAADGQLGKPEPEPVELHQLLGLRRGHHRLRWPGPAAAGSR